MSDAVLVYICSRPIVRIVVVRQRAIPVIGSGIVIVGDIGCDGSSGDIGSGDVGSGGSSGDVGSGAGVCSSSGAGSGGSSGGIGSDGSSSHLCVQRGQDACPTCLLVLCGVPENSAPHCMT